ncbi:MAG TPA: hypothetical protein DHV30_06495, partial [Balneola sp.]|nr:hypothetical protein [Balneola sp.]
PTPAMKFGTMLHAACLEPDVFYDKFKIVENKRTKEGKAQALDYDKKGITVISPIDAAQIANLTQAICDNPKAYELLNEGLSEQSFWWTHNDTKLDLKCRCDKINGDTIVDLKTTG